MALFVSGLSHRNAPVELREQLAVDEDKLRELLADIAAASVVREAIILSTCNRVEVYAVADVPSEARALMFRQPCPIAAWSPRPSRRRSTRSPRPTRSDTPSGSPRASTRW